MSSELKKAISILEKMLTYNLNDKDGAGIYIPVNVDENIRQNTIKECIQILKANEY